MLLATINTNNLFTIEINGNRVYDSAGFAVTSTKELREAIKNCKIFKKNKQEYGNLEKTYIKDCMLSVVDVYDSGLEEAEFLNEWHFKVKKWEQHVSSPHAEGGIY